MQNDARQQRRTMSHFQRKDPADRFSAQQVHQKVRRKPVSVPKGFFATILTYLQQLQTQQSKAGRQNWHEWSSTFLHGKTQKRRPGQDKKKVFFFLLEAGAEVRLNLFGVFSFPSVLFCLFRLLLKQKKGLIWKPFQQPASRAGMQSNGQMQLRAITGSQTLLHPAAGAFALFSPSPGRTTETLYPQCLCCRKVSPIIHEIPKDNSYLFFPRLLHPLLTQRKEKKKLTRTEFCFPTHDFFLIRFAAATDTVMTASIHIRDLKGSLKK